MTLPDFVPAPIVTKLATDLHAVLAEPEIAKKFRVFGAIPADENAAAFKARIK